jgi:hypothetical protein
MLELKLRVMYASGTSVGGWLLVSGSSFGGLFSLVKLKYHPTKKKVSVTLHPNNFHGPYFSLYLDFLGFIVYSSDLVECLVGEIVDLLTRWGLKGRLSLVLSRLGRIGHLFLNLVLLIELVGLVPDTILFIE